MTPIPKNLQSKSISDELEFNFNEGFTQSELTTLDNCPEKWFQRYYLKRRKKGTFSWSLVYGSAVHATLENWYKSRGESEATAMLQFPEDVILTSEEEAQKAYFEALLPVQFERYMARYPHDVTSVFHSIVSVEEHLETTFEGIRLRGKIDLTVRNLDGDLLQFDHKTSSRIDNTIIDGWEFRFQFMFYVWLRWKCTGERPSKFCINAIKKPALRQKKDESTDSFVARIGADMCQEPDKYFQRIWLPFTKDSVENFETYILIPKLIKLRQIYSEAVEHKDIPIPIEQNPIVRNLNTDNCVKYGSRCEYFELCKTIPNDIESFQYTTKTSKHEELEEAE